MDLEARIAAAEADLNAALDHAQDLAVARRQVRDALDDLRVYRNLLALAPFGVPRPDTGLPIPAQQRRRAIDRAASTPQQPPTEPEPERRHRTIHGAYREALIRPRRP